jgi:phosphonate transport system substrate-binding protein
MKYIFSFITLSILILNLYAIDKIEGKMGVLTDGLVDAVHKDYSIAFNTLIHRISDDINVHGHLKYYDSEEEILKDFLENNLDYMVINPIYYLKNQKELDMDILSYWSVRKYKTKFQKMVIVVRKDSGINTVNDLKDKTVMLKNDNYMGKISLDKAILESKHISSDTYIKDFYYVSRDSTAVLKTFFSKVDASIVSQSAFDIVADMNPAVNKSLKIIYKTDSIFIPMLSIINKNISLELMKKLKKVLENFHLSVDGKNILTLFKMNRLDILEYKELDDLRKYYTHYIYLKKKYGLIE